MIHEGKAEMNDKIRPMPLWLSVTLFGIPCLLEILVMYRIMPWLDGRGLHPMLNYAVFSFPMILLFAAAFIGLRLEGRKISWPEIRERFRLNKMNRGDWVWSLGLTIFFIVSYVSMVPLANLLYEYTPSPDVLDKVLGNEKHFAGFELAGNWWLLGVFFAGYFFNIAGEELWWRGYIFPRQILQHGRWAWIVQGLLWTLFHVFFLYDIALILPGALGLSYVCQRRRSTWPGIIAHGALNALAMIRLVKGVIG